MTDEVADHHDVLNPATEEVVATVRATTPEGVDAAVAVAVRAQRGWAALAPADPDTAMGPLIPAAQRERVRGCVRPELPVVARGKAPQGAGFWYPPTVPAPEDPMDPAAVEEIFGPVAVVLPFTDEADALRLANATPYGLSGSLWTRDLGRAVRPARGVTVGNLSVNSRSSVRDWTPFGGFKQSGLGRELGPDALSAFTETNNVFVATEE